MESSALARWLEEMRPTLSTELGAGSHVLLDHLIAALSAPHADPPDAILDESRRLEEAIYRALEEQQQSLGPLDAMRLSRWFAGIAQREEVRRYTSMLDALPDHIVMHDAEGRLLYMNRPAREDASAVSGVPTGEIVGHRLRELGVQEALVRQLEADTARAFAGETVRTEHIFPLAGAQWREYHASPWHGADGKVAGAVFVSRDIHARKLAELRVRLLSKVGLLADTLEHEGVLPAVVRASVPDLADLCILDVIDRDEVRRDRIAHRDPAKAAQAEELIGAPSQAAYQSEEGRKILAGSARLVTDYVPGGMPHLDVAADLQPLSAMIVPFMVLGRAVAVATFVTTADSARRYNAEDLAVAQEVALRAAHVIENGLLQQELRDRDASLRVALAKSNICVFEQDAALKLKWMYNPLASGAEADELREDKRRVLVTGERMRSDRVLTVNGEPRHLSITYEPLRGASGDIVGLVGSAVDVTEDKRIQAELTETLDFRDRLIGVLGHDLRNPLSAVLGIVGLAKLDPQLSDAQRSHIKQIDIASRRMAEMINALLDFTQARFAGKFPISPAPMDLRELCQLVVAEARAGHPGLLIELDVRGDARGAWDAGRVAQVVSNLVGNAIAHGDPTAPIRLALVDDGTHIGLEIHNRGPAVPADLLPVLFQPFRRGNSSRARGLGLGLYIVQQVVTAHGGSVSVTSTDEDGTTFTLRLPRKVEASAA